MLEGLQVLLREATPRDLNAALRSAEDLVEQAEVPAGLPEFAAWLRREVDPNSLPRSLRERLRLLIGRHKPRAFVKMFCKECPAYYWLPVEGVPRQFWMWGATEPPDVMHMPGRLPMDVGHDIRVEEARHRFRFSYSQGEDSWIVLQYAAPNIPTKTCRGCAKSILVFADFCPSCGVRQVR